MFETTIQKTNELLRKLTSLSYISSEEQALQVTRAVLFTLRDRLTAEEANSLGAQFTPLLRGIYYEGWAAGSVPKKMNKEEFLATVESRLSEPVETDTEELVRDVLTAVGETIEPAELQKLKEETLPSDIAEMIPA